MDEHATLPVMLLVRWKYRGQQIQDLLEVLIWTAFALVLQEFIQKGLKHMEQTQGTKSCMKNVNIIVSLSMDRKVRGYFFINDITKSD